MTLLLYVERQILAGGLQTCGSEKQFQLKELHYVELEHNQ